jgi:predicted nucleotidyltransferase
MRKDQPAGLLDVGDQTVHVSFRVPLKDSEFLRDFARLTGRNFSSVGRQAIAEYVAAHRDEANALYEAAD